MPEAETQGRMGGAVDQAPADQASIDQVLASLRASEARYRSVVAALAEGVAVYDDQGRLVASNPMAARILGLDRSEYRDRALGDQAWETVHEDGSPWPPDDYPAVRTLRTGAPLWGQVMGVRRPDG